MKLVYLTLALAAITQVAHSDCSTVDLRADPRMPAMREQGDVAWCFVAVAADLLSFKTGRDVSYLDLALMANEGKTSLNTRDGGQVYDVLEYAKKNGYCLEGDFPENRTGFQVNHAREEFQSIEALYSAADKSCQALAKASEAFPDITMQAYLKIIHQAKNPLNFLRDLDGTSCSERIPVSKNITWVKTERKMTGRELLKVLDAQLDQKNPVGIGYAFHLNDLSRVGIPENYHASTVVGRALNPQTGNCEYIVRNEGGTLCKNADGSNFYQVDCEQGYLKVPAWILEKDMADYTYINR